MIEFSFIDLGLIAWASLATASWLSAREEARVGRKLLLLFIENKEAREQVIKAHEEFMRREGQA